MTAVCLRGTSRKRPLPENGNADSEIIDSTLPDIIIESLIKNTLPYDYYSGTNLAFNTFVDEEMALSPSPGTSFCSNLSLMNAVSRMFHSRNMSHSCLSENRITNCELTSRHLSEYPKLWKDQRWQGIDWPRSTRGYILCPKIL